MGFNLIEQRNETQEISELTCESGEGSVQVIQERKGEHAPSGQVLATEDNSGLISNNTIEKDTGGQTQGVELQKGKKGGKKTQWGPVIPLRRSSTNMDNGKPMMEKTQEAKRKWNLDDKPGNASKTSKISKPLLLSVAKNIDLIVPDGDPDVVESMIQLDCSRNANSKKNCTHSSCSHSVSPGKACLTDKASSSKDSLPTSPDCQDGNADNLDNDQEAGWSKVGPRKKNKKHRK